MHKKNVVLKEKLLDKIRLVQEDIEMSQSAVTDQAKEHISDNDLILTYDYSETLISFLKEAAEDIQNFEVIVCETAPSFTGHKTAKELAQSKIRTSLVQDSAIFAIMSRVNKVIISPHGIMATGGVIAKSGALLIAHAARAHQVPVFIIGSMYKLTPLYPIDSLTYNELLAPSLIFRPEEGDDPTHIEAIVPAYDYIPPKLVTLVLTD